MKCNHSYPAERVRILGYKFSNETNTTASEVHRQTYETGSVMEGCTRTKENLISAKFSVYMQTEKSS